ncbi:MAG TPA: hypothetical protein VHM93_01055 [Candidatus Acidoferrum sp.]|nr:hypothetical protein [Candidatus Acidoferrum sp.]
MRLSRSMLIVPVTLFGPLLLLALWITAGCQPYAVKPPKTSGHSITLNCDTQINVNPGPNHHGVDRDVYVCDGDQVSFKAPANVTFTAQFASTAPADCPFNPCPASITNNTPSLTVSLPPSPYNVLTVYKFTIDVTAGGTTTHYDPHVVGGGGF